jgi:ribose-phosphate pyrophosphokinase
VIVFSLSRHERLAATLVEQAGIERGRCSVARFPNGELHARIDSAVEGRVCIVLGATAPPDEDLLATLLLGHTLTKEGASRVVALVPYLGYARHDRAEPRTSRATAWLGALLGASAINDVVTVDVHSSLAAQLFPMPLCSLSPATIFARAMATLPLTDPTVVAPDEGAVERCEAVRKAAAITRPLARLRKTRTPDGVHHSTLEGSVGPNVIVVDDILDTGSTLVSACETFVRSGAGQITVMVTHGLFTGDRWRRLFDVGVSQIYCTDTTPVPPGVVSNGIRVLSIAPLLSAHLASIRLQRGRQS